MTPEQKLKFALLKIAGKETGPKYCEKPERWWDTPLWRCVNNHVSQFYIKSEAKGGAICPACQQYVFLTFPEDKDGPLSNG